MDSITHIVLGACIGEVFVGKKIGKRALLLGAIAQSVPDIDFIASFWLSPTDDLLAHRGFTHSILFAALMTPFLAMVADRWRRPHHVAFRTWIWFFGLELFMHLLLDTANAYGTGWLEPFSHQRFSYHTLFVADPLFSIVPGIVSVALLLLRSHRRRRHFALAAIGWCSVYLVVSIVNKIVVERDATSIAASQHITFRRHFTTPTPFNIGLWYVVLESDSGYYIGYRSVFDRQLKMDYHYFPRNDALLDSIRDHDDVIDLLRFSQGYYTVSTMNDKIVFSDLRFGQITGWQNSAAPFAFYYYLQHPEDNLLIIQRGRFKNWNKRTFLNLIRRIKGN
jgi:inner membrane protein